MASASQTLTRIDSRLLHELRTIHPASKTVELCSRDLRLSKPVSNIHEVAYGSQAEVPSTPSS